MQKVTLSIVFLCLLPLVVLAQGNRFIRYNCLANHVADSSANHASNSSRKLLASLRTDWQPDRLYRVPVILVEFSDRQFSMENPCAFYDRIFNEMGHNLGNGPGCVADYFREQSGGLLNMKFDVVGPIRLESSCKGGSQNYGTNLFRNAALKADSLLNYAEYDWDGRGSVTQVVFVYAGYGGNESSSKSTGCIWPNTSSFSYFIADGTSVRHYTASAELWSSEQLCGIGTICHEFSHCLGLPDIYPTAGSEFSVLDEWDLMDGGNYSDKGWCPPNYTVHEKELLGWFSAKELYVTQSISGLSPLSMGGDAFRITNDGEPDEYYLLENRQQKGWDSFIPGHGLTIIHVDFKKSVWADNTVNRSPQRHRLDFFHACGHGYTYYETLFGHDNYKDGRNQNLNGSAYPYVSDTLVVNELTDTSVPVAATLFNPNTQGTKFMGKPIMNIQESADGLISFNFYENIEAGIRFVPDNRISPQRIYNLHGQRLHTPPQHGLYIINGRKHTAR